jgi:hypothetical protein
MGGMMCFEGMHASQPGFCGAGVRVALVIVAAALLNACSGAADSTPQIQPSMGVTAPAAGDPASAPASPGIDPLALAEPPDAQTDVIPGPLRTDWAFTGVPGGIPMRTRLCATLGRNVKASAINAALALCSSQGGGVVQLQAGTYRITGIQVVASNVTLRGAGADQTVIKACNAVSLGNGANYASNVAITAGGAKDSRQITVASTSGMAVGTMIEVDRDNEAGLAISTSGGSRHMRQVNVITAISGNTLTLRNPLVWNFNAGTPRVKYTFTNTKMSGVEDLKIDHSGTSGCTNFMIQYCDSCWVKGVESANPAGYHFTILGTVNGEFRDSFVHDAQTYGANNAGLQVYGNAAYGSNSSWKIENNIFNKTFPAIELQNAASGFYMGYNFSYGSAATASNAPVSWTFDDNHGPHDMMNLWEGNSGEMFGADGYYGSSSHATVFRNHFTGYNRNSGNADEPVRLNRLSYAYSLVGNVLGLSTWSPVKYEQNSDGCAGGTAIYRLGYPNIGNCGLTDSTGYAVPGGMSYPDAKVSSTLLRWGNYDTYNKATRFNAAELPAGTPTPSTQALRASYYYAAKPAWFGAVAWPPIGPDVSNGTAFGDASGHVHKIPAQLCWENRNLLNAGSFNAKACYGN